MRYVTRFVLVIFFFCVPATASVPSLQSQKEDPYRAGTQAINNAQWEQAVAYFQSVIDQKGDRSDGAIYWKAYALNKLGRKAEVLSALQMLKARFPDSNWIKDANALELEVRQAAGQKVSPDQENDEELKMMALNGLLQVSPERAIPILEKFLKGSNSEKLKERALFILAQSGGKRAMEIIKGVAQDGSAPALQARAIQYIGLFGGAGSRKSLEDLYHSSSDPKVKQAVLKSFMVSGSTEELVKFARQETDPKLAHMAIQQLGAMGAKSNLEQLFRETSSSDTKQAVLQALFVGGDRAFLAETARTSSDPAVQKKAIQSLGLAGGTSELANMYSQMTSTAVRKQIIQALFLSGSIEEVGQIARQEKNSELQGEAIRHLGLLGGKSAPLLTSLYTGSSDTKVKEAVIQALFLQGNASQLIEIARREKDPNLKREAVQKLSLMGSKEAQDFLLQIINQ